MIKFKMFCPDCGAMAITATPQAAIWESCPGCGSHIWDIFDALMADVVSDPAHSEHLRQGAATQ